MHITPDLRARTNGRPRIYHRARPDVSPDVHIARHQHDVRRDVCTLTHDGVWHNARTTSAQFRLGRVCVLHRYLVVEACEPRVHDFIVMSAEIQQHSLLEPLIDDPLAIDLLGNPRLARVEEGDALLNGSIDVRGNALGSELSPALERPIDDAP